MESWVSSSSSPLITTNQTQIRNKLIEFSLFELVCRPSSHVIRAKKKKKRKNSSSCDFIVGEAKTATFVCQLCGCECVVYAHFVSLLVLLVWCVFFPCRLVHLVCHLFVCGCVVCACVARHKASLYNWTCHVTRRGSKPTLPTPSLNQKCCF